MALQTSDQLEIQSQQEQEAREILACLLDIRRRTGWGSVVIELKGGEITEIRVTTIRKPKVEKRDQA